MHWSHDCGRNEEEAMKSKPSRAEAFKGQIALLQRKIEQGECHPSWGKRAIAQFEKRIIKKEKAIRQRRK